ncbi:DUF2637 domain-containing protein [Oerskovia sp. NPDC060338]|uniref:DUF2637 domain-containing protein n=1 Tax=Oerskovia sp. NPDC060338 TaxID=3347100 RepID=UPI00366821CA
MSATAAAQALPHRPDTERPAMTAQSAARRPARINPDTVAVLVLVLLGIAALIAASAALSFDGLTAIAAWAGVLGTRAWLVPVFIEGAILVYTGVAIVHQSRHENRLARRAWTWVRLWTLVSSAANGAHAWDAGPGGWQGIVGVVIAALIPVGVYVAVHMAAGLIVELTALEPAPAAVASAETIVAEHDVDVAVVALDEAEQSGPATVVYDQAASSAMTVATLVAEREERSDVAVADLRAVSASRRVSRGATDDERIVELARTTHLSGTKIAEQLGTNKNRTCALVRQVREDRATTDALWAEPQAALA